MTDAQRLSAADQARIAAAVQAAEAQTSGEIVTIIAEQSDDYADVALWWSVAAALLALGLASIIPEMILPRVDALTGRWAVDWTAHAVLELGFVIAASKFAVCWLILLWRPARLWLVPAPIRARRVRRRAVDCFKVGAERRTTGRTGILLYLSLAERRAEIVADAAIHSRVAPEDWGKAMADLVQPVRDGRIADGLVDAIGDVGVLLAQHLPRASDDVNELPDRMIHL
ncbi:MAG: hypothetical protein RJB22_904 [Pseudomonadota bacterium]|jgi:putative membrane protein